MGLSDDQRQEVVTIAKLTVHEYFDHYLANVFPQSIQTVIDAHDHNCAAHGSVTKRFERFKWLLVGLAFGSGIGGGIGLTKLITMIAGS